MIGSGTGDLESVRDDAAWLRRLTRGLTESAHDADLLCQDTLSAAWSSDRPEVRAARPWLSGIARRIAARSHRDAGRRRRREIAAARSEALPATLDLVEHAELRRTVDEAVRALPEPYREVLQMRFWDDLKPGEIAARVGVPVETVRTRQKRALATLRDRLDASYGSRAAWVAPLVRWTERTRPLPVLRATGKASVSWIAGLAIVGVVALAIASGGTTSAPIMGPSTALQPETAIAPVRAADIGTRTAVAPVREMRTELATDEVSGSAGAAPSLVLSRAQDVIVLDVMQRIVDAQSAFRGDAAVDVDGDRRGEHGDLGELAGLVALRGENDGRRWRTGAVHDIERIEQGIGSAWGYDFRIYLPGQSGTPIEEAEGGGAGPFPIDTDRAEEQWCCYAWPSTDGLHDEGSTAVFFVDQTGCVLVADNADRRYVGRARAPFAAAAFRADTAGMLGLPSAGTDPQGRGRDGQIWRRALQPASIDTVIEVVDASGAPVADVQVVVQAGPFHSPELRYDFVAQSRVIEGVALPIGPRGFTTARTGEHGRATLSGRATVGAALMLYSDARQRVVPTRITPTGDVLRVEMPTVAVTSEVRASANEFAAIATLKNISSAQAQCQAASVIDVDGDGQGEYGYFGELSGACFLRGPSGPTDQKLSPPVLSSAFGRLQVDVSPNAGVVVRSGYCFQVFLPYGVGRGLAEAGDGGAGPVPPDPEQAERAWCCYAWPFALGESGTRAFFIDQHGDVLACDNDLMRYSGFDRMPQFTAARAASSGGGMVDELAANARGLDGQTWIVVN